MSIALKWGLITGMVYVLFSLGSNLLGLQNSSGGAGGAMVGFLVNGILMVITFFTIYKGIKEIRDEELSGEMTTGLAVRKGMKIALIAGLLAGFFSVLYTKVIDPGFFDRMMEATEARFDQMNTPESQREMSRSIMKFMFNPLLTVPFTILWVCFWGLLKSLVAGSMLKNEGNPMVPPSVPPTEPTV